MTETLNQIKETYEKDHNVTLTFNFDSSGTLKTQIQEGADCDLFVSAGQERDEPAWTSPPTRRSTPTASTFVAFGQPHQPAGEQGYVLVVPEGNPEGHRGL